MYVKGVGEWEGERGAFGVIWDGKERELYQYIIHCVPASKLKPCLDAYLHAPIAVPTMVPFYGRIRRPLVKTK